MSQNENTQDQPAPEARDEQLADDSLESVAGGVHSDTIIGGGCIPEPWIIPPFYSIDNG